MNSSFYRLRRQKKGVKSTMIEKAVCGTYVGISEVTRFSLMKFEISISCKLEIAEDWFDT